MTRWQHARRHLAAHWRTLLTAAGGACILAAVLTQIPPSWWSTAWNAVVSRWWLILLLAAGVAGLIAGGKPGWQATKKLGRRQAEHEPSTAPRLPDRKLRPIPTWTIAAGALLVAAATWSAVTWLQSITPDGATPIERDKLRIESIRTGLTVGAGVAGGLALLIALRRQQLAERDHLLADQGRQLAERAQEAMEHDAAERRITELYVKAADQLGSNSAPVRLAGLYALERLAQDNPDHRKTVVEVICAYLRMPYAPPEEVSKPTPPTAMQLILPNRCAVEAPDAITIVGNRRPDRSVFDPHEERQVRLAAQDILRRHLRPSTPDRMPNPMYWESQFLNLAGACLIELNLNLCQVRSATFNKATFHGPTQFRSMTVTHGTDFGDATFIGETLFNSAALACFPIFRGAKFIGEFSFEQTYFDDGVLFDGATFNDVVVSAPDEWTHVWPVGWRPDERSGRLRLVAKSAEDTPAILADGNDTSNLDGVQS